MINPNSVGISVSKEILGGEIVNMDEKDHEEPIGQGGTVSTFGLAMLMIKDVLEMTKKQKENRRYQISIYFCLDS